MAFVDPDLGKIILMQMPQFGLPWTRGQAREIWDIKSFGHVRVFLVPTQAISM